MKHVIWGTATLLMSFQTHLIAEETKTKDTEKERAPLEETFVYGSKQGDYTVITENAQKLVDMPGALGDPLSAVFSLPGVVSSDGGFGEPAVRGSSPNDNLYIVDFLPAGYVFHTFTNSVFSEFIIQDFNLYSAGFGPEYGNVTGAAFDIKLRKPRLQEFNTIVDLSLLRSGIFTEGQVTENSAFYLSARKSLIHLVVPDNEEEDGIRVTEVPQDEDYQFKYAWSIGDHALTLSANGATDLAEAEFGRESDIVRSNPDFEGDAKVETEYHGQNLIYDYTSKNGGLITLALGRLDNSTEIRWGDAFFNEVSLDGTVAKGQVEYPVSKRYSVTIGAQRQQTQYNIDYDQILFTCTEFDPDCSLNRRERLQDSLDIEITDDTWYINNRWSPISSWTLDIGGQWQKNDYTDESFFNPMFGIYYQVSDTLQLRTKYGKYNRLPEIEFIFPSIGNPNLESPTAEHSTLGFQHELGNGWSWDLEFYYKTLEKLPLALSEDDPDGDLLYVNDVEGKAYGFDLLINKENMGNWYGWLALSYGKSERTNLRTDQTKNYFLDTPLILNWVMNYQFNDAFDIGWRLHARSGSAYTPIIGVQENPFFEDAVLPVYGDPFSERLPTYATLDVRFKWSFDIGGNDAALIVDIINATNRQNATDRSLDYERVQSVDDEVVTEDSVSPGVIPTITFRFSF